MTHTPASIRALLDGITAGEWVAELVGNETWDVNVDDSDLTPVATDMDFQDAHFLAASPGIARYALELAAENARLRGIFEGDVCSFHKRKPNDKSDVCAWGFNFGRCSKARRALTPQPAPTNGVE